MCISMHKALLCAEIAIAWNSTYLEIRIKQLFPIWIHETKKRKRGMHIVMDMISLITPMHLPNVFAQPHIAFNLTAWGYNIEIPLSVLCITWKSLNFLECKSTSNENRKKRMEKNEPFLISSVVWQRTFTDECGDTLDKLMLP